MEHANVIAGARAPRRVLSAQPASLAAWALGAFVVLYLGLRGGGYDILVRGQVGIALWWVLAVGVIVGAIPALPRGIGARVAALALALFVVWTLLGLGWSEDPERTWREVGRVLTYLAAFLVALAVPWRRCARPAVDGIACGIVVICAIGVFSRLKPQWFGTNDLASFLPGTEVRLAYPLNYWNGLAALAAMSLPLLLARSVSARSTVARAAAAAAIPLVVLCGYLTVSRGGVLCAVVGVAAFLALTRERLAAAATTLVAGAGSALAVGAAAQRHGIRTGIDTPFGRDQGAEMLAVLAVVCLGVALLQVAVVLVHRHVERPRWARPPRAAVAVAALLVVAIGAGAFLAAGGREAVSHGWRDFKNPVLAQNASTSRFSSVSGHGRYQFWDNASHAATFAKGTGPGTFELRWARTGTMEGFVRNAHSLVFETLGETGVIGLILIAAFFLIALALALKRVLTAVAEREVFAGAAAAALVFTVAAAIDWVWQLPVLPITFLVLVAMLVAPLQPRTAPARAVPVVGWALRIGVVAVALAAAAAIAVPVASVAGVRKSQTQVRADQLSQALQAARDAQRLTPGAATPRLQEALVLERLGQLEAADQAARRAVRAAPTEWRTWLVVSRLEAKLGHPAAAVRAFRRARELNPKSPIFR